MAIGDRIKRVRNLRGMTQKELGIALGYSEEKASTRIAEYESGIRTPKDDKLEKIAEILNVNYYALYEAKLYGNSYASRDLLLMLFELEDHAELRPVAVTEGKGKSKETHMYIGLDKEDRILDNGLYEWAIRKQELENGEISEDEYLDWKLNFPNSSDERSDLESYYNWRKKK